MTDLIKCDNKLKIQQIKRHWGPKVGNKTKEIVKNIDKNLLAFEGLEVRNETGKDLKVRLVLVRATGRFFLYIEDPPCNCDPISFKDQEVEHLEGHEIVKARYFEKIPITEAEF